MEIFRVSKLKLYDETNRKYVAHCVKNPDPGSGFDLATRFVRNLNLPDWLLFFIIVRCMRYDGIICYEDGTLIGHCFFQKHWRYWGVFSVFVMPELRGRDYAKLMLAECLKQAQRTTRLRAVRIGAGGDAAIRHIFELAVANKLCLPFYLKAGDVTGEVVFVRPVPSEHHVPSVY